jgi:hypothetical protein
MIASTVRRILNWYRLTRTYGRSRSQSDHRATSLAVRLTITGALQNTRQGRMPFVRSK